jgi:hypothetical protein
MSLRLEMLQVARLAPEVLGDEAVGLVAKFIRSQRNADGGFCDRAGRSDLYYTSFAVDALTALQRELPEDLIAYLDKQDPVSLDFVHTACLARLLSAAPGGVRRGLVDAALARLETFRAADGGYNQVAGAEGGSCYACFLAYGAYADHRRLPPEPSGIAGCLGSLAQANGGWSNDATLPVANVPATAAAVALSRNLRLPIPEATATFLLSARHPGSGGFVPFPGAPLPDLLSTAVALHALDGLQADFESVKEPGLDFIDSLWTAEGGFHGHWDDDVLDLEYTYYGLLALGHLAL